MSRNPALSITRLEDRTTPAAGSYAVGVLAGQTGDAVVYAADGTEQYRVAAPYGVGFTGGVRVTLADVTGDGTDDLVVAPGAGTAPTVKVYDGAASDHALVASFDAYESSFTGGVYVAAADITGDGLAEIVVGADLGGGPRVRVFDGSTVSGTTTPIALADFLAIDDANFRGGVRLALGDISGDGTADLLVGAGYGGGPRIAAFDGASLAQGQTVRLFADFFAFEGSLRNGAFVSVGDVNGDGCGDMVFGAGPGGGPRVRSLDGKAALEGTETELSSFFAGDASSRAGVEPNVVTNSDGTVSIAGTDVATGQVAMFAPDGGERRDHGRGHGGGVGGPAFHGSPLTVADATAVATAVTGTYDGTGAGTLSTLSTTGTAPTTSDADVTVGLEITSALPVVRSTRNGDATAAPLREMTVTGTVTLTIGDAAPVTYAFSGTLELMGGTAAAPRGRLTITADSTGTTSGFRLNAMLNDDALTVTWLVASDHSAAPGGYVFQSPASRTADRLTLTQA